MMRIFILSISFLAATQSMVFAQTDLSPDRGLVYKSAISIVPQYAVVNGIRIDYEIQLKNKDKWLLFAPQFYLNNDSNGELNFNYDYDKMSGFGMNVYYKLFLGHSKKKNTNGSSRVNTYVSFGPTYQYFRLINRGSSEITTVINKFGGNANFGLQFAFGRFLLDGYAGIGFRHTIDAIGGDASEYWISYGYSGFLFDAGVRVGFYFTK